MPLHAKQKNRTQVALAAKAKAMAPAAKDAEDAEDELPTPQLDDDVAMPRSRRARKQAPRPPPIAPRGAPRLIDKHELLDKVPLSYPSIWQRMQDGRFPRSRSIDGRSFWVEAEIDEYIANLPIRRLKADGPA